MQSVACRHASALTVAHAHAFYGIAGDLLQTPSGPAVIADNFYYADAAIVQTSND